MIASILAYMLSGASFLLLVVAVSMIFRDEVAEGHERRHLAAMFFFGWAAFGFAYWGGL